MLLVYDVYVLCILTFIGWLSGREAEYMEKLSDEEVGKRCVEVLTAFLRKTIRKMPNLKKVTRWVTFGGCISYMIV